MKFDVVDTENNKVGQVDLDDSVWGATVKPHLFWEVVRMQMANRRAGTHSTKTVSDVAGTGAKPYRQKGTGRARHGSRRAMNMRGGGVVHGPQPRSYEYRMPKKMVKVALRSALSLRAQEKKLVVVQGWKPEQAKTKDAANVLNKLTSEKALVVGGPEDDALSLSVRNLPKAKFLEANALNVRDVLYYDHLIITEDQIAGINERLHTELSRKERAALEAASGGEG